MMLSLLGWALRTVVLHCDKGVAWLCVTHVLYFFLQISEATPASLFVGARLVRHFRFIGEINAVVVFDSLLSSGEVLLLHRDYPQVLNPTGDCTPYLGRGDTCPTPSVATSLLCQSVLQL